MAKKEKYQKKRREGIKMSEDTCFGRKFYDLDWKRNVLRKGKTGRVGVRDMLSEIETVWKTLSVSKRQSGSRIYGEQKHSGRRSG